MSAFSEDVGVMLLETADGRQRLLWRRWKDMVPNEAHLEPGEFERIAGVFLPWAERHVDGRSPTVEE